MLETKIYWTIVASVFAAIWAIITTVFRRNSLAITQAHSITACLLEFDKLMIGHPEVLQYLSKTSSWDEDNFRDIDVLDSLIFFKAKTVVYHRLNLFDEILCMTSYIDSSGVFLRPPGLIEKEAWDSYILQSLTHPLCRSALKHEGHIFGSALQEFWKKNEAEVRKRAPDAFSW